MKKIDNIQFCIENGYITNKFYMILLMKTVDLHQNFNNSGPKVPLYFQDLPKFWTSPATYPGHKQPPGGVVEISVLGICLSWKFKVCSWNKMSLLQNKIGFRIDKT